MRITARIAFLLLLVIASHCSAADISLLVQSEHVTATNGLVTISVNLRTGQCDYSAMGSAIHLNGTSAGMVLGTSTARNLTTNYSTHALASPQLMDILTPAGVGKQFVVRHLQPKLPTLEQVFTLYPDKSWMLIQLRAVAGSEIRSNWMTPLMIGNETGAGGVNFVPSTRVLEAPYDNDDWHWYAARPLDGSGTSATSHEFSALYDNHNGAGIVFGSVTHDFWKTGIDLHIAKVPGRLDELLIYGGASTDDACPHGAMAGKSIESPTIFLGFFSDIRTGLEEYGHTNAAITPPLPWHDGVPVGWMSFGALGAHYTLPQIIAVSDFIKQHLQQSNFHNVRGKACIILDGNRNVFDNEKLKAAVDHIHQNDQQAGCYLAPFIYWRRNRHDTLEQPFGDTGFTYAQVILRDEHGRPIPHKPHSYALDVTHPAVRQSIAEEIDQAKQLGFDYFKFDFLTDGSLEGVHADPTIHSGIQAYNQAMRFIADRIGPGKFIGLSIAPAFPGQYAQSRRISCDTYSQINDGLYGYRPFGSTQYLLNCATFSWWMGDSIYSYNDPDEMAIERYGNAPRIPESWARARITASIVCGGNFIDSDDYTDLPAAQRVEQMLTRPAIDAAAREGIAFTPLFDEHMEKDTATVFYRPEQGGMLVAIFNFNPDTASEKTIRFSELGLAGDRAYMLRDLWMDKTIAMAKDHVELHVGQGDALLLRIDPK